MTKPTHKLTDAELLKQLRPDQAPLDPDIPRAGWSGTSARWTALVDEYQERACAELGDGPAR